MQASSSTELMGGTQVTPMVSTDSATAGGEVPPPDVKLPTHDPQWVTSLVISRLNGQVAFVTNDSTAWVVEGTTPRQVIDDTTSMLWPER